MAEVKIDFNPDHLVDVLVIDDVGGSVSGSADDRYLAGRGLTVRVNLYEEELVDQIIDALTAFKRTNEVRRLEQAVKSAERNNLTSQQAKLRAYGFYMDASNRSQEAYQALIGAREALALVNAE